MRAFATALVLSAMTMTSAEAFLFEGRRGAPQGPTPAAIPQAEWPQDFAVSPRSPVEAERTPLLSEATLSATIAERARLERIVAAGGWPRVSVTTRLSLGMQSDAVPVLRRRLMFERDLAPETPMTNVYDSHVEAAVRRLQARHGLPTTGVLDTRTLTAMNVPADVRLAQITRNIARLETHVRRRASARATPRHVVVNIPAAKVESVSGDRVVMRHAAGVGRIDRRSPVFDSQIVEVNFNPFWTVPTSIIRRDLIPLMQREPDYLTRNRIRIFDRSGAEIPPERVNWFSNEAMAYRFRQDPGGDINSMGFVRINIPNPHGVFMHDTPLRGVFGDPERFVSSGCVRIQDIAQFVEFALAETPGWDRNRIRETFASGERLDARLSRAIDVHWVYVSAWASPEGTVHYRNDIYETDAIPGLPTAFMDGEV